MDAKETEVKTLKVIEPIISPVIIQAIATLREVAFDIEKWHDNNMRENFNSPLVAYDDFSDSIVDAAYHLSCIATSDILKNCFFTKCDEELPDTDNAT